LRRGTICGAGGDTKSGEGSAIVGHHDRTGLKPTRHQQSWNSSHGSRGCSQDQLKASGGAGLIYCFVASLKQRHQQGGAEGDLWSKRT
jgi:hypothetical protein